MFFNVQLHDFVLLFISCRSKASLAICSCRSKVNDSNSDAMLLEVVFYFFFKALHLASDDQLMPEDVFVPSTVILSTPFVMSSSASDRSNLLGTLWKI